MSQTVQPRKLKGFRDFTPIECRRRQQILEDIRTIAQQSYFEEISTPALEYQEVLLGCGGGQADNEVYRFLDHGDRAVALRFDLTVPFARYVAEHQGTLLLPFKKFQVGEVWRGEKPQKGRYRQFCQADFDIVGVDNVLSDVEIVNTLCRALDATAPSEVTMMCGDRILLVALIRIFFGNLEQEQEKKVLVALDKFRKIGHDKTAYLISQATGLGDDLVNKLLMFLNDGEPEERYERWNSMFSHDREIAEHWKRFDLMITMLKEGAKDLPRVAVTADLGLARGLGYYTGVVFEAGLDHYPDIGSISGGGRYNELISRFSNRRFAGIGGSVGVDRLLAAWEQQLQKTPESMERKGVMVAIADEQALSYGMELVNLIRAHQVECDVGLQLGKLGHQFRYADRRKIKVVVTVGTDEVTNQTCAAKNLETGLELRDIDRSDLMATINESLKDKMNS
jgi:histidyl-tRNA synthetase